MTDLTTIGETTRSLDGTEYLRVATSGANWKSTLSSMFLNLGREKLTADRTYYVRTDGSDSNTGLVDSAGGAFLTIQKAVNVAAGLDCAGSYKVKALVGAGTFTGTVISTGLPLGAVLWDYGGGERQNFPGIVIEGVGATTIIASTDSYSTTQCSGGNLTFRNCKITNTVGDAVSAGSGGNCNLLSGVTLAGAYNVISCYTGGTVIANQIPVTFELGGGVANAVLQADQSKIQVNGANVVTGVCALGFTFAYAQNSGMIQCYGGSFTGGTITGQRYFIELGGMIQTAGGGANFFPGNVAGSGGTTAGGGYYA